MASSSAISPAFVGTYFTLEHCGAVAKEAGELSMRASTPINSAIAVARQAHQGDIDQLGRPYFTHCERVAAAQSGIDEKVIAYLHDVVEKAFGWTLTRLAGEGFSLRIISAVDALTRRRGESDEALLRRIAADPLARPVEKADLLDNIEQMRESGGDTENFERRLALLTGLR